LFHKVRLLHFNRYNFMGINGPPDSAHLSYRCHIRLVLCFGTTLMFRYLPTIGFGDNNVLVNPPKIAHYCSMFREMLSTFCLSTFWFVDDLTNIRGLVFIGGGR
jgi:hypothetical protein